MNNIKLIKLKWSSDLNIKFKSGINYIVGLNGSGKTTIFSLIQYILGLKKEFGIYVSSNKNHEAPKLEVTIGGEFYEFKRELGSREITIISDHGAFSF